MTRTQRRSQTRSGRNEVEHTETEHDPAIAAENAPGVPQREWILVVLDPDDPRQAIRAALRDPAIDSGSVDLLLVFPTVEFEQRWQTRRAAGVTAPYAIDQLEEEARLTADRIGREFLDKSGRNYAVRTGVGRTRDFVLDALRAREYVRLYLATPRRRLWQRLLRRPIVPAWLVDALPDRSTVVWVTGREVPPGVGVPEDIPDTETRPAR